MQDLLFDRKHTRTDIFTYRIIGDNALGVKKDGEVAIHFLNGKFSHVYFPFTGKYTRNGWRILAAIEAEIARLEGELTSNEPFEERKICEITRQHS